MRAGVAQLDDRAWWTRSEYNWNNVCFGGLVVGALAIADTDPEWAERIVPAAVAGMPRAIASYDPDGAWMEGPACWAYATRYTVWGVEAMRTALGTDYGLSDPPELLGAGHLYTAITRAALARVLLRRGNAEQAEPMLREALEAIRSSFGPTHGRTLSVRLSLCKALIESKQPVEARAELTALLTTSDNNGAPILTGRRRARAETWMGQTLTQLDVFDEAETHLLSAVTYVTENGAFGPAEDLDPVASLVELYEAWHAVDPEGGHDARAAEWRSKRSCSREGRSRLCARVAGRS